MTWTRYLPMLVSLLLISCDGSQHESAARNDTRSEASSRPVVVASNYPMYFLATRIIADTANTPRLVLPLIEGDPANWTPTAEQIQQLQGAELILLNGAGAEAWLDLVTLDNSKLIDTTAPSSDRLITMDEATVHRHGPEGDHSHQGTAFTTWLDPELAMAQASVITGALSRLDPENAVYYAENLVRLEDELSTLDHRLDEVFQLRRGQAVLFSHPVYQYLQRRYAIEGVSLHWEPSVAPTISDWLDLRRSLAFQPTTLMMWEDEPLPDTTDRLAALRVAVIPFRTAANRPADGDFFDVMTDNIERLESVLKEPDRVQVSGQN